MTTTHYPIFEDNQVLTSGQLNDLFQYLDQQTKRSRTLLSGIGIVCGLKVNCLTDPDLVEITGGVGVTSEGYLVKMRTCLTAFQKPYTLPDTLNYPPFEDPATQEQDITLFELLTEEEADLLDEDAEELDKDFLDDKVLLLFVECFDQDMKSCLGKSCDELGINRMLTIRKLLVTEEELQTILDRTDGGKTTVDAIAHDWEHLLMLRPDFGNADIVGYFQFVLAYLQILRPAFEKIKTTLQASYVKWEPILASTYGGQNPLASDDVLETYDFVDRYLSGAVDSAFPGVQYMYDYFKDLLLAYRDFHAAACNCPVQCCPEETVFPKHLNLGALFETDADYRNHFTASPAVEPCHCADLIGAHQRIITLLRYFDQGVFTAQSENALKITPSLEKSGKLSHRSIPHYYRLTDESGAELNALKGLWSGSSCHLQTKLSYHENTMADSAVDPVATPLHYDIDAFNFFRVEGYLGLEGKEVFPMIRNLQRKYGLEFHASPLFLGSTPLDMDLPDCLCSDLQAPYGTWRNKTLYFLKSWMYLTKTLERYLPASSRVKSAVAGMSFTSEKNAADENAASDESMSGRMKAFAINKDNWHLAGARAFEMTDEVNMIDVKEGSDDTAAETPKQIAFALLKEYNTCLLNLVDLTTASIKRFDKDAWIAEYQCLMYIHIKIMRAIIDQAKNRNQQLVAYVILLIYCKLYEILSYLAIYPYLTMGGIMDLLDERATDFRNLLSFGGARRAHPGIRHMAGVPVGGTLFLLMEGKEELESRGNDGTTLSDTLDALSKFGPQITVDQAEEIMEKANGRVIGDMALHHTCCDPCANMRTRGRELSPLVIPKCGVMKGTINGKYETSGTGVLNYRDVTMRMISHNYDLGAFEARLVDKGRQPEFGVVDFEMRTAGEMPDKQTQYLRYQLDFEKAARALANNTEEFFLIDEFDYEIVRRRTDDVVGQSTITVFIPVIDAVAQGTVDVTGFVMSKPRGDLGGQPVPGAKVIIRSTSQTAFTNKKGQFVITAVPAGEQTFAASVSGFKSGKTTALVDDSMENVIIEVEQLVFGGANVNVSNLSEVLNINRGSVEENVLRNRIARSLKTNNEEVERLLKANPDDQHIAETAKTVNLFTNTNELATLKLNNAFVSQRNKLNKEIARSNNPNKAAHTEALEVLTLSYLNRLNVNQPSGVSGNAVRILSDTARVIKKVNAEGFSRKLKTWKETNDGVLSDKFNASLDTGFKVT